MRRENLWKKALAVILSASLLVGSGAFQNVAFADVRTEVLQEEAENEYEDAEVSVEALEREVVETALVEDEGVTVLASNSFENLQCGEEVYATLSGGTLTISGTGKMWGAGPYDSVFADYLDLIREIVVEDGVTSIGSYAFCDSYRNNSKLEKLTLGKDVESIGKYAFYGKTGLRKVVCPSGLKTIGDSAFYDCSSLQSVSINEALEEIGYRAFYYTALKEVVIPEGCVIDSSGAFSYSTTLHYKTTVTLNANGGTVNGASTTTIVQYEKEAYGNPTKLPTPTRSGYDFLGWYDYTDDEEGNKVTTEGEKVKYHAVLRAKWCNHKNTIVKNAKSATYTKEGYTGDTYCKTCGKAMSYGKSIACKTLAASKITSVDNTKNGLKITWTKSKDAKGYYVYRKQNGVYKKIATVTSGKSYVDTSVKASTGKTYTYKVCAYYGSATSKMSAAKSKLRIASPTISSVKSSAKKSITVKWAKVSKVTGYQIEYSTDKSFTKNVSKKTVDETSQISKTIKKLSSGKKYYVRMRTYKVVNGKKQYSAWSNVKSVKVK